MAIITEKNVGALNKLTVEMSVSMEIEGATISYNLSNDAANVISFGSFKVDEEFYLAHATDKQFILDWVIKQLQLTLA
jgi:hypothetical protein